MKKIKLLSLLLSMMMIVGMLAGCSSDTDTSSNTDNETTISHSADEEIVLAGSRDLVNGIEDVYFSHYLLGAWEPLISAEANGEPMGILATSWESNADATEWTFYIREGVNFQNGEALNADIVVENFERYALMTSGYSSITSFAVNSLYPNLIGAEAIDEYTVKVSFSESIPQLLYNMKDYGSCIFYPGSWDLETGYFVEQPVGTGAYTIVDYAEDEYALLSAFDGYWGDAALTQNIRVKVIADSQTRYAALQAEEVMGVLDLGAMPASLASELLLDDRFAMASHTSNITHYVMFNSEDTVFGDVRIRQAISMSIDRQAIVDAFYGGYGTITQNILNPSCSDWVELPVVYDLEAAQELAAEVLGDERVSVDMYTRELYLDRYPYKETMEYIQSQLALIGIDATINIIDSATYSEMVSNGELGANFMTHGISKLNAENFMRMYMHSEGSYNVAQQLNYYNADADAMLDEMAVTLDQDRFHELAVALQEIANEELPIIPLFYDMSNLIYNTEITGYEDFTHTLVLSHVTWAE